MNARSLLLAICLALLGQNPALAIVFDQAEVPGIANGDLVVNQWDSFGIIVSNARWYNDFDDDVDNMGVLNLGSGPSTKPFTGTITFITPIVDAVFVEWAQSSDTIRIEVFDSSNTSVGDPRIFNGQFGNVRFTAPAGRDIKFLEWSSDSINRAAITTLAVVPEPASWGLVGLGIVWLALIGRRRARSGRPDLWAKHGAPQPA